MGIEKGRFPGASDPENRYTNDDRERYASELREYILENIVRPHEYYKAGKEAFSESTERGYRDGVYLRNELIGYEQRHKASAALEQLDPETRKIITAHGIASNVPFEMVSDPEKMEKFPLFVLLQVMATGILKGDFAPLVSPDGIPVRVFTDAPFILLSNKGESLAEYDEKTGENRLRNLRAVLVNGQYEPMIERLRKTFPGVSFWVSEDVSGKAFEKKNDPFISFEDMIKRWVSKKMGT